MPRPLGNTLRMLVLLAGITTTAHAESTGPAAPAQAQQQPLLEDVTLHSREGQITLSGQLQSYDGEFYRLISRLGPVTVDAEGVVCDGPACPELLAPHATIRVVGAKDLGQKLVRPLFIEFAKGRGLNISVDDLPNGGWRAQIGNIEEGTTLADVSFISLSPEDAASVLRSGEAEFMVTTLAPLGANARPIGYDALVPVVAKGNPLPQFSTATLAKALSGQASNWAEIAGPDMPIIVHALTGEASFSRTLDARLGVKLKASQIHESLADLAQAVADDPWALALTGRAEAQPALIADLVDSCGFPLLPSSMAVKSGDYPLALPIFLQPAPRRIPLLAREFYEYLFSPTAERVVADAGYIDRGLERAPMTQDGLRLLNAIRGAGDDVSLADLKELSHVMEGAERLSLTFRFDEGTAVLDAQSQDNLAHLAQLIASEHFPATTVMLTGFSDSTGNSAANRALAHERARRIVEELAELAPDLAPEDLPVILSFGEALPIACDQTAIGRHLNRRVEVWLKPNFTSKAQTANTSAPPSIVSKAKASPTDTP